ncbi:hypothetical protein J3U68_06050 [Snodgrassella sp. B3882]|uniref:hypothetical protein n=1 Tax=Snodgrassella sp. B3882 TaxID=2818037 RepID=UPI00226A838A|nr:hypothetical protein [Snodgrassella sp. B3882]MCX8744974.1 hypothetical protein [Snodgrassella sp. B3882]
MQLIYDRGKRCRAIYFGFFNYLFSSEEELKEEVPILHLSKPIIILTINGNPVKNYRLNIIGAREINDQNVPNYKNEISPSLGLYRNQSQDFDHMLKTFFGLHPWDGFYQENYVNEFLTQATVKRKDVKYLKDFSIGQLKQKMPANSFKLK